MHAPTGEVLAGLLQRLYEGNARYADGNSGSMSRPTNDWPLPPFAFLTCTDCSHLLETIFDLPLGVALVTQVPGNLVDETVLASLEFSVMEMAAQVVYVLGHDGCRVVRAAVTGQTTGPGSVSVRQRLVPAIGSAAGDVDRAVADNVQFQAAAITRQSPQIAERIAAGTVLVAGGVFDASTRRVHPVAHSPCTGTVNA